LLQKRGGDGARVHIVDERRMANDDVNRHAFDVPGFPVEVANIPGAGDAFAAGALYGFVQGWDWYKAARLGNACGAIVVTRHGCANFMPTYDEVTAFVESRGGF